MVIASNPDIGLQGFDQLGYNFTSVTLIPLPAAVWLFGSGLLGLIGIARRRKAA